jgi:hypothetical protein
MACLIVRLPRVVPSGAYVKERIADAPTLLASSVACTAKECGSWVERQRREGGRARREDRRVHGALTLPLP